MYSNIYIRKTMEKTLFKIMNRAVKEYNEYVVDYFKDYKNYLYCKSFVRYYFDGHVVRKKINARKDRLEHYYFWLKMHGGKNYEAITMYNSQKRDKIKLKKKLEELNLKPWHYTEISYGVRKANGNWFKIVLKNGDKFDY